MKNEQQRHDISDAVWSLLEPHLPGQRGQWGGMAQDNRRFINGVFWIFYARSTVADLPPFYGKWGTVYQRFRSGVTRDLGKLLEILVDEPDFEWLMIDASHCKVHPHAAGAHGGNQDMSRTKGAQYQDSPCRGCKWYAGPVLITEVPELIAEAIHLIDGISAETLLADRGYDTNQIIAYAADAGMDIVIPAKRKSQSSSGGMTVTCISFVIWWKMLFCT